MASAPSSPQTFLGVAVICSGKLLGFESPSVRKRLNNHTLQNFVAKMVLCMKCFVILPFICCFKSIRVVGIFKLLHAKIYTCYIRLLSTFFLMGFLLLLGVFDSLHFPPFALTNALPVYIYAFSYAMQHKMQACRCISVYHSSHCKYILL